MKRSRDEPSLPELPDDVWKEIARQAAGINELFKHMNLSKEDGNIQDPDACEREIELLKAVGPVRLVNKLFSKRLHANQICGAYSVALRRLRVLSVQKHQAKLDGVTDDLGDDFDRHNVDDMANVSMKAGCMIGIGRGLLHMGSLMQRAGAEAFRQQKYTQLKGIVELIRFARVNEEQVYANIGVVRWS